MNNSTISMRLAARAEAVQASQTIVLDTQAKALLAAGKPVINLSVGELDFAAPETVLQAAEAALKATNTNRYSPVAGQAIAKQAVVDYYQQRHHLSYAPSQVVITNGAKQALYSLMQVLVNPGDEVLILNPAWVSYVEQIQLAGGKAVTKVSERTVGLILNYPNNPTGDVYTREQLEQYAALAKQHGLWVVSDEMYEQLCYDGTEFISFAHVFPDAVIVNGISKASAVTGWRVGFACGPQPIIDAVVRLQSHLTGNVSNIMQAALPAALNLPPEVMQGWLASLTQRRDVVVNAIAKLPQLKLTTPKGAFYTFIDIRAIESDSVKFCERLLQEHYVALVPGAYFGQDGFIRISFANSLENVTEACRRLSAFVLNYKV